MGVDALIALGGNIGDVRACFVQARASLAELPASSLEASSLLYHSPPMGPVGQTDYLNAVVRLKTSLRQDRLLEHMQAIEKQHGRERSVHWGARTLDLDLLACGDTVLDIQELTLPHPHMHERMFV
ncbi:MAG: 2-amino-4-hydroxy-6-hydroxymethyldihydropteridine diphosphokinase, partial [Mariprofundaceae bacterium]